MEYLQKAEQLFSKTKDLKELVCMMQEYLGEYFNRAPQTYQPKSILESRFTPPSIAFRVFMTSCGSKTNIVTSMLRHLGYEVKKVHGSIPESADHAWLQVQKDDGNWQAFDPTRPNCEVTPKHKVIAVCDEWEDLSDEISQAHLNYIQEDPEE
jgi:hypothetical protein